MNVSNRVKHGGFELSDDLFVATLAVIHLQSPDEKCRATRSLTETWLPRLQHWPRADLLSQHLAIDGGIEALDVPGRPERPILVSPREMKSRNLSSLAGRQALLHAVAHIEFNAINLALDAVYRFRDLPLAYYCDWLKVADDEARHFVMVQTRLNVLGMAYGDLPAHNGLWDMAIKTRDNAVARMALVPRVLEARGLDVTPGMIERLHSVKDSESAAVLEIILREEVAHVAAGSRWLDYLCRRQQLNSTTEFLRLVQTHVRGAVRGPFNVAARLDAGFTEAELAALAEL